MTTQTDGSGEPPTRPERDARGWVILRPASPVAVEPPTTGRPPVGSLWERHDDPEENR